MPLIKPPLVDAVPGMPITAGAWNTLVGSIEALSAAIDRVGLDYVEITVTDRGVRVPDARVTGVPLDPPGPALLARPLAGTKATHVLVGVRGGGWRIAVDAKGFASESRDVTVAIASSGPSATLAVPLTRTTLPTPNLVGLAGVAGSVTVPRGWAFLTGGSWESLGSLGDLTGATVAQGPSAQDVARRASIGGMTAAPHQPWRAYVPDLLGWPVTSTSKVASSLQLSVTPSTPAVSGNRIVSQSLRPGREVALPQDLSVTHAAANQASATFAMFGGTHPRLAATRVTEVVDRLRQRPALLTAPAARNWTPWEFARIYATDALLTELVGVFPEIPRAAITDPALDLEAVWRTYIVAVHWFE